MAVQGSLAIALTACRTFLEIITLKKLPIGISTLQKIRDNGCVYVDKTAYVQQLVESGAYYFLSRPRRFGKSLLVDTLRELFQGNEALFRGLHIHPYWDWSVRHPVISLSFGGGEFRSVVALENKIGELLRINQQRLGITCQETASAACFAELIRTAHARYGQGVVVLVDEYDKPILDAITNPAVALENRGLLRDLYSVIKDSDAHIRFALLTGVSKFSKVSLFSGLNNLNDITLDGRYSALCGYTQTELEQAFADSLQGVDMALMKRWYNGYAWLGESVYNPFDVLLFLDKGKEYLPHWFETGSPTFLVDVLKKRRFHLPNLEAVRMDYKKLGDFDVDRLNIETLLFQTGYLTIKQKLDNGEGRAPDYLLTYPNHEVRYSLMSYFLDNYLTDTSHTLGTVSDALCQGDLPAFEQHIRSLFDNIAYENYSNNPIAQYEGYYAAVMYAYLCALGMETRAEVSNNLGRIDLAIRLPLSNGRKQVYVIEFKMVKGTQGDGSAMQQIKAKDYAAPYRDGQHRITLLGMEFSAEVRNLVGFAWEVIA